MLLILTVYFKIMRNNKQSPDFTLQETTVAAEVYNVTFVGLPPNSIGYNVQVAGVIHNKETTPGSTSAATSECCSYL